MASMLTLYRRHLADCKHRTKGRAWMRCQCPVWASGSLHGAPLRQSLDTVVWRRAEQIIQAWETGERNVKAVTVAEALQGFMADLEARGVRPPTRKKYRQLFDRLSVFSESAGIGAVAQIDVQFCRDFRASWGAAAVTGNKMLERLRAFCKWCVNGGLMRENPARLVVRAKEEHPPTMPYTPEEMAAIMRALANHCHGKTGERRRNAERLRALVLVMRWTAFRISDAVSLRRSQIENGAVLVRQAKTAVTIRIPLHPDLLAALGLIDGSGDYFFAPGDGRHETRTGNWRRALRPILKASGVVDAHAHRFRDTLAVELLLKGVPIERVSMMLGHEDVRTTQRHYAPWVLARQQQLEADMRKLWDGGVLQGYAGENFKEGELGESTTCEMVSRAGLEPEGVI